MVDGSSIISSSYLSELITNSSRLAHFRPDDVPLLLLGGSCMTNLNYAQADANNILHYMQNHQENGLVVWLNYAKGDNLKVHLRLDKPVEYEQISVLPNLDMLIAEQEYPQQYSRLVEMFSDIWFANKDVHDSLMHAYAKPAQDNANI